MIGYLDRLSKIIIFFYLILSFSAECFSDDLLKINIPLQNNSLSIDTETGRIINLTYKTIKEIQDSQLIGRLIDIYYPNKLMNFYIFIFKSDNIIYKIAALPEEIVFFNILEEVDISQFYAIGYYGIDFSDEIEIKMFYGPNYETPFDFLHRIRSEQYISIKEIEEQANIVFDKVDKGGFLSPFHIYIYNMEYGILSVLSSPSDNKENSYFMGGWSYSKKIIQE